MKIIKTIVLHILILQIGCASVRTAGDFSGIELTKNTKPQYNSCTVGMAYLRENGIPGSGEILPNNQDDEFPKLIEIVKKSGICKSIAVEDTRYIRITRNIKPSTLAADLKKIAIDLPDTKIMFYQKPRVRDPNEVLLYAFYGLVYVASIGLVPLFTYNAENVWMSVQEAHSLDIQVTAFENSTFRWYWTPFYLSSTSDRGRSDVEASDKEIFEEGITAATNSISKPEIKKP